MFKILVSAFVLGALGCAYEPISEVAILVSQNDQPEWVTEQGQEAIDFWSDHGVYFRLTKHTGNIVLHSMEELEYLVSPGQHIPNSVYEVDVDALTKHIYIKQDVSPYNGTCYVARALGFALNLGEIDSSAPSLMDVSYRELEGEDCFWSESDQQELERVR